VLSELLKADVVRGVFERSHFKKGQLDSLLAVVYVKNEDLEVRESVRMRDKPVTLGSLERSASQAEAVISKSIATLVLAVSLGIIDQNVVDSVSRLAVVVERSRVQRMNVEETDRVISLIDAVLWRSSHK
jgi:hypothetical protein